MRFGFLRHAVQLLLLSAVLGVAENVMAQKEGEGAQSGKTNDGTLFLGPIFNGGQNFHTGTLASGWKSSARFAWSAGADAHYLITDGLGLDMQVVYDVRGLYLYDSLRNSTNSKLNYLSLRPELNFGSFLLGLGIGIPLGSSSEIGSALTTQETTGDGSGMNLMLEVRVGLSIPVMESDFGLLKINLGGSYCFTRISNSVVWSDPTINNGPLASIGIGVVYLFNFGQM